MPVLLYIIAPMPVSGHGDHFRFERVAGLVFLALKIVVAIIAMYSIDNIYGYNLHFSTCKYKCPITVDDLVLCSYQ
jgi:hypothetical protein